MVNYWKSKVLPKIKKVFENPKKVAAAEACKSFDEAKEEYSKEFQDKKTELEPKVIEIYEASSAEVKTLVKEPKDSGLKKHSAAVEKFLDELSKIGFPGSKQVCEAATKVGAGYLPGPVFFVFEKVSTFIVTEEKKEEAVDVEKKEGDAEEVTSSSAPPEVKDKEIGDVEPKEEVKVEAAPEPEPKVETEPATTGKTEEPSKVEEGAPAEPPKP
ncbi:plasma membrane-associated cation-binding protein 1-like [Andrographis paniculata]|uniref:plasma membrane-associated cation-binding protein 1-like n=1 Tax=Andrographis paniculata TaxID=175694 RepID=UPI0021E72796|nr:plasma membrane-associated cation-binding protein 1-like [Andrographis paniculata]